MKMKTDNARRLVVRTCGLVLMSMATAMSLWLRSPRSYTRFIIIIITKLKKIPMTFESPPPHSLPYFWMPSLNSIAITAKDETTSYHHFCSIPSLWPSVRLFISWGEDDLAAICIYLFIHLYCKYIYVYLYIYRFIYFELNTLTLCVFVYLLARRWIIWQKKDKNSLLFNCSTEIWKLQQKQ